MLVRPNTDKAILIFIVAYNAEKHIAKVFSRIPDTVLRDPRVSILCIDDSSNDNTSEAARKWVLENKATNICVLRNPVNQGYGGNQKLGYRLAIEKGFDFTILLHGDGQYAPELLPEFIAQWEKQDADVVLGSRMQNWRSARKGGMPWYKVIGNKTLTWFQNRCTGQKLTEYHTGYRGYSSRFLRKVPFECNTNDFHFDTEILLQAFYVKAKTIEFPIPTHYGDEICHVNGMKYAWNIFKATLQYKLHQMGMLCSLKYRKLEQNPPRDKVNLAYTANQMVLKEIKRLKPATVTELGCGPGHFAEAIEKLGPKVTGLDATIPVAGRMSRFYLSPVEADAFPIDPFQSEMILLMDVLERVREPEDYLIQLRNQSTTSFMGRTPPAVVVTTPNIGFFTVRLNLLLGRFPYSERGILAIQNKRFFTKTTLKTCLRDSGYKIEKFRGIGVPFEAIFPNWFGKGLGGLFQFLAWVWPRMFAFQFLAICRPNPGTQQLLRQAVSFTEIVPEGSAPAMSLKVSKQQGSSSI